MSTKKLNVVDENDNVIGAENRSLIHKKGLLHREVHVYFVTPKKEIIFQHRAKDKETFPDLLDATVGGHVEIGDSYEEAAVKEALEETGIVIDSSELIAMFKIHKSSKDGATGIVNHAFQQEFIYFYKGRMEDLKIEQDKGLGFKSWTLNDLINLPLSEQSKFIPYIYDFVLTKLSVWLEKM